METALEVVGDNTPVKFEMTPGHSAAASVISAVGGIALNHVVKFVYKEVANFLLRR